MWRRMLFDADDVQDRQFLDSPVQVGGALRRNSDKNAPAEYPGKFRVGYLVV